MMQPHVEFLRGSDGARLRPRLNRAMLPDTGPQQGYSDQVRTFQGNAN